MEIHFGSLIKKRYDDSRMSAREFAAAINTGERNIYTLFKQGDLPISTILKCGEILKYDFLSHLNENIIEAKEDTKPVITLNITLNKKQQDKVIKMVLGEKIFQQLIKS